MPVELFRHIVKKESSSYFQTFTPSSDLTSVIEYFFLYTIKSSQKEELAFADGIPILAFLVKKPSAIQFHTATDTLATITEGYLSGFFLEKTYIEPLYPNQQMLGVRFKATGLYNLLRKPLSTLAGQIFHDVDTLFGGNKPVLNESFTITEKINAIENWIREQLKDHIVSTSLFEEIISYICTNQSEINLRELAVRFKVNYKWIERKFLVYIGLTPKEFIRLQRFLPCLFELQETNGIDLMGLAINHGFYDQNHFIKEFKRFTQKTPLQFLKQG
ncbi:helix-turn-helix domain-containing protein [Cytophagaceae bacterium DM2B3-1]|uniref:Helix-turn-helix domain-containing protein n=1 Tax=Xanthocytophaga flava TaxID=3048013 RepID=A0ABT7CKU7_9BACT|nr:helix-turn-helix domain-containing protein [Xanthocytophaga flavus]MDJ1468413.1 helix-turn-helix domain-containing protein [Xanthocytophaga flavus]MDJ1493299.1 helix-turn-helix domain-containing protein [Xanthocytophaga flavus]